MNDLIVISRFCAGCGTDLLDADNFCRHCGLPTVGDPYLAVADEANTSGPEGPATSAWPTDTGRSPEALRGGRMLTNRLAVIAILLCLGPIGLPVLWASPRFSGSTKILTTAVVVLVTVIVPLGVVWYALDTVIRPVLDVFEQTRPCAANGLA